MCKFLGKSNERILCKLSESEILRFYSIIQVALETTKTSNFTCQSKFFISTFSTCQVLACELQPFSCHDLANDTYNHKLPKQCSATLKELMTLKIIVMSVKRLNGRCTKIKVLFLFHISIKSRKSGIRQIYRNSVAPLFLIQF